MKITFLHLKSHLMTLQTLTFSKHLEKEEEDQEPKPIMIGHKI
jgi:hypothetical protein